MRNVLINAKIIVSSSDESQYGRAIQLFFMYIVSTIIEVKINMMLKMNYINLL